MPALRHTQLHVQWVPVLNPGVKRSGRGVDNSPPSSAGVKERVELYFYSPLGTSWPILGWNYLDCLSIKWVKTLRILMKRLILFIYFNLCRLKRALHFSIHLFKTQNTNQLSILISKLKDSSYTAKIRPSIRCTTNHSTYQSHTPAKIIYISYMPLHPIGTCGHIYVTFLLPTLPTPVSGGWSSFVIYSYIICWLQKFLWQ
jgi:hypothetical protein